jgi:hypothetical protein
MNDIGRLIELQAEVRTLRSENLRLFDILSNRITVFEAHIDTRLDQSERSIEQRLGSIEQRLARLEALLMTEARGK